MREEVNVLNEKYILYIYYTFRFREAQTRAVVFQMKWAKIS